MFIRSGPDGTTEGHRIALGLSAEFLSHRWHRSDTSRITAGQSGAGAIPALSTGLRPLVTNVVGVQTVVHFAGRAGFRQSGRGC